MEADRTDKLIASAITALPYRRPSAGFSARVMAGIAAEARQPWYAWVMKAAGLLVAAWGAVLAFAAARLVYLHLWDVADLFLKPGGLAQAFKLLAAQAALVLAKVTAAVSFLSGLASAAGAWAPAWYEIAAATALCSAAIAALSHGARAVVQRAGN